MIVWPKLLIRNQYERRIMTIKAMFFAYYDRGKGDEAMLGDHVASIHLPTEPDDRYKGVVGGFFDTHKQIAIVILDEPEDKLKAVTLPVVCLQKMSIRG